MLGIPSDLLGNILKGGQVLKEALVEIGEKGQAAEVRARCFFRS